MGCVAPHYYASTPMQQLWLLSVFLVDSSITEIFSTELCNGIGLRFLLLDATDAPTLADPHQSCVVPVVA